MQMLEYGIYICINDAVNANPCCGHMWYGTPKKLNMNLYNYHSWQLLQDRMIESMNFIHWTGKSSMSYSAWWPAKQSKEISSPWKVN